MTYIGREDHFRCDWCGGEVHCQRFPGNWVYVKSRGKPIRHACSDCKDLPPREDVRRGGDVN